VSGDLRNFYDGTVEGTEPDNSSLDYLLKKLQPDMHLAAVPSYPLPRPLRLFLVFRINILAILSLRGSSSSLRVSELNIDQLRCGGAVLAALCVSATKLAALMGVS
jgi:hypothetical protein